MGTWKAVVTVLIPDGEAATEDDAIDMIGERLKPLSWAGRLQHEDDLPDRTVPALWTGLTSPSQYLPSAALTCRVIPGRPRTVLTCLSVPPS